MTRKNRNPNSKKHPDDIKSILDMNLAQARHLFTDIGEPNYRAAQALSWIYHSRVTEWRNMSNLPLKLREKLASRWPIMTSHIEKVSKSKDATTKLLIRLSDSHAIESVLIPEEKRNTVCLSTQVGCPIRCSFCASGTAGLKRNLSAGEILEQILHVFSVLPAEETVRNVVFMGMGEPMRNYHNVMRAVRAINAEWAFQIGARRITVSTVGDVAGIERLAAEGLQVNLAISLHAADDRTRSRIVPGAKMAPVSGIVEAARNYFAHTRRRVSFEHVLIDGVNSSITHARTLGQLLRGFPCFVNLIPLNPVKGISLTSPDQRQVRAFLRELEHVGIPAAVRAPRGTDISAACGQLAGESAARETGRRTTNHEMPRRPARDLP